MWPFKKKSAGVVIAVPCQCSHFQCYHEKGVSKCKMGIMGKTFEGKDCWGECPCAFYIASPQASKEAEILEKMMV